MATNPPETRTNVQLPAEQQNTEPRKLHGCFRKKAPCPSAQLKPSLKNRETSVKGPQKGSEQSKLQI